MSELARRLRAMDLNHLRKRWVLAELLAPAPSAHWPRSKSAEAEANSPPQTSQPKQTS